MYRISESTIVLTDFAKFSSFSNCNQLDTLWRLIVEYQSSIIEIALTHHGELLNVAGDSLLIGFHTDTKTSRQQSAYRACLATIEIAEKIHALNKNYELDDCSPLVTRIGVNSGSIAQGSLSVYSQPIYLGNTINVAQRLEHDVARQFGETAIVISENTMEWLNKRTDEFSFDSLDSQPMRGMDTFIQAYRLEGLNHAHAIAV